MKSRILNVSYEEYLRDEIGFDRPSLNGHVAHAIESQSPAHAFLIHPRLNPDYEDSRSMATDKGSVIHALLLNVGRPVHIMQSVDSKGNTVKNFQTKVAREERDLAYANGEIPLFLDKAEELQNAALIIQRKLADLDVDFTEGKNEFAIAWESDGVLCRTSIDSWADKILKIRELKTTHSANPHVCQKMSHDKGYHMGYAARMEAIHALYPELAGRVEFEFIFVEIEPPYDTVIVPVDGMYAAFADFKWNSAKAKWKRALESGVWPGYESWRISVSTYAMQEIMEEVS